MSYIPETKNREEFVSSFRSDGRRGVAKSAIKAFDLFCNEKYQKEGVLVLKDLVDEVKNKNKTEKIYVLLSQFADWLNIDHPNIIQRIGMNGSYKRIMKKVHPRTLRNYLGMIQNYFEDVGGIDVNERKLHKRVKYPKIEYDELEALTHEEIKLICDLARPKQKMLYMFLKDTGCRIGEAVALRKRHIILEKNPIEIHIPSTITKTGKSRIAYVTSETKPMLINRLEKLDQEDFVFGVNKIPSKSVDNEEQIFAAIRKKAGFTDRYESNNRFKKNIHSFRAFTCTQVADVHGEEFAHGYIGHSQMLPQYIRYKEKLPQKFKQVEPKLMIYEKQVIVEHNEEVNNIQSQLDKQGRLIQELLGINDEKTALLRKNTELQKRMNELELKIKS
jgi:integrase